MDYQNEQCYHASISHCQPIFISKINKVWLAQTQLAGIKMINRRKNLTAQTYATN